MDKYSEQLAPIMGKVLRLMYLTHLETSFAIQEDKEKEHKYFKAKTAKFAEIRQSIIDLLEKTDGK